MPETIWAVKPLIARHGIALVSGMGKVRWVVERACPWLHQFKRLRIRYERRRPPAQAPRIRLWRRLPPMTPNGIVKRSVSRCQWGRIGSGPWLTLN
ncbi:hypothetical protein [Streptomyces noursei]|uniref:hypothetical protein n=1 Tax=Streptomyces noursei TaxID=1971 RepID=UPI003F53FDBC